MEKKDWEKELSDRIIWLMGRRSLRAVDVIEDLLPRIDIIIEEELSKAREEGFDNGVEKTVNIIQRGLDELLLEKGEEKYWVGDILRDCGSSVEEILPQNMKHYKSKLKDNK
ncbi:MAG: hypothetical protein BWY21_01904 [Parcubacteria group bacterium ADurb.Bin216]|nr:MAG: hypothetical protein BWY21_01904 [Parcubacteria group bacterium ADurb.Bin216]